MSDAKTIFSLSLRDEATRQLKSFEGSYRKTVQSVEGADGGGDFMQLTAGINSAEGALTTLGATAPQVAAAMLALGVASTAVDWARQAAEAQAVETAFTRLAGSVGTSGASMLASMQAASSGMISDMDLMLAANTAMALGVADNSQEMTSLLQVAIAKGAELGVAPMKAFGDLINGLGRMSPEILNNIGVVVDAQAAYAAYAQSIGVTVEKLNEQQKMQALVNAVLAANPDAARQAAAAGDSAAAAFARWDVATQQFSQTFGAVFLPLIADGLDQVTRFVNAVGGVGDVLAGKIDMTPEQIDVDIAEAQAQIADYETPGKYAAASNEIARLRDQIAMLEQAKRLLIGTTVGVTDATQQEGAAAQDAAVQSTRLSAAAEAVRARLAALAGQSDATSGALRSMWTSAAGALGAATAFSGWQKQQQELETLVSTWSQYGRMSGEQIEFQKAAWLDAQNDKLQNQVQALTAVGSAAGRAASGGLSAFDSQLSSIRNNIESSVQAMVSSALDLSDISWPGQDIGGDVGDAINENARRLAAIANEGLIDQDWLGEFAAEAPGTYADLMLKIASGMDAQGAAQQLMAEFQAGLRPDLLDFEQIKQRIKDELTNQQAIANMTDEITAQLVAELGVSAGQVQSAIAGLGLGSGAPGQGQIDLSGAGVSLVAGLSGAVDLTSIGAAAGTTFSTGLSGSLLTDLTGKGEAAAMSFAAGFGGAGSGAAIITTITQQMTAAVTRFDTPGREAGLRWGVGFTSVVEQSVGPYLVDMLVRLVTPGVMAAMATAGSAEGAQ